MYLAWTSNEMRMNPDVFGLSNTSPYIDYSDDVVMMWWTYYLISQ
jgi:hypothetical protein